LDYFVIYDSGDVTEFLQKMKSLLPHNNFAEYSPFEVKALLWDQVKQYLKPSEADEIESVIGTKEIEANEASSTYSSTTTNLLLDLAK
jgi:hypothetical protein